MIVLDASAAVELLLGTASGRAIAARIAPRSQTLNAPHLIDIEVAHALRRYVQLGQLTTARARQALDDFCGLDVERFAHEPLLPRIWALRSNASAYDAAYLALAEALSASVVTHDAKLSTIPGVRAAVEVY